VNEDLLNQVAFGPRMLQPHAMESTEVTENLAKCKITQLQIRNNNVVCVFQATRSGEAKRDDPSRMCEQRVWPLCLLPYFEY